ncbi:HEPN domain containing protein [Halalkaliarchaeum sp. AArc-CO]|uniref:type VII toxin-antitoxin system HepT family RNase toxin n=1 Tax=Halalkaliarchaeum sp. AArc-CO TaxID=2866381 RepID=UPI00217D3CE1|nr:DUF86 domain-containing protein [Halalkaliarchaeum sp. AArc-CO]UWG51984.1 HEPN domain containing protein [Halalkaliarchaeum sp. AArc-CO]
MTSDTETIERIVDKVEFVADATGLLARKQSLEREEYLADREQQAIVEREFQVAIEACIDIAELLIRDSEEEMPATNADKFHRLERLGALSTETATRMGEAAGFRNVLAHNYGGDLDDEQVYSHLQEDLRWFPIFCREVRKYLDEAATDDG